MKKSLNKFTEDFIVSQRGQWDYPGLPTAVPTPSGKITTKGVKDDLIGIDNLGNSQYMTPGNEYQFEGDMVYEIPQVKKGGSKKPSKKLSSSLMAKNILFTKNQLFKKAKSVKNKIFDPNSPYFKEGGAFEIELDDAEIDEYRRGGYIVEELDAYAEGGRSSSCPEGMVWSKKDKKCIKLLFNSNTLTNIKNRLNSTTGIPLTTLSDGFNIKPLNSFSDFGKEKPITMPVREDSFLETLETDINDFLEKPLVRAAEIANNLAEKGEDQSDPLRHSTAGALTAQTIANKTGNIPFISNPLGYLGSNIAGIGHELSTLTSLDNRPWSVKLQESLEDMYNNSVGASTIFNNKSEKDKINYLLHLTRTNQLPDGYGEERPFKDNPKWTDPYNKKQYGGGLHKFVGGGEPCPNGFEYVDGNCVEKSPLENCEDGRCEETDQIQKILDEGSYIPKKNINMMWDVVGEMDKRDPFGNAGKIWTGKGAQSLSKRLGMDNPSNCMWAAGMGYQCLPETKGKLPLMPFESNDKFINAVNKGTIPFSRVAKTHDPNFASQETGMLQQGDIINFKGAGNSHAMTFSNYREDGVPIFLDSNGNATDFGFNTGLWKDFLPNKEKVAYVSRFNPEKFYEKDIKTLEEKARTNPTMIEKQFGGTIAGTEGLTDNFSQRLSQFILDARTQGIDLNVGSGYRSYEKQKKLWEQALKKYGSPEKARKWVAPPGSSNHNKGLAVDLSSSGLFLGKDKNVKATEWAHANAKKYGLNFRMGWEPWHIEPLEKGNSKDDSKTADDHDHSSEFGNDEITKKEKLDLAIKNKDLEFENKKLLLAEQEKIKNDDDYSNWTPRKKIEAADPTKALLENYSKIINPSLQNINNIYTSNLQGQMKRGGIVMDLDDDEIETYKKNGYVVENYNENNFQDGGNVSKTWELITGTPWADAKNKGYTTGSYDDNIALLKKLNSGDLNIPKNLSEKVSTTDPLPIKVKPTNPTLIKNIKTASSFNDAFTIARKELGTNQIFEYNGRKYGTNLKGETFNPSKEVLEASGMNTPKVKTRLEKENKDLKSPFLSKSTVKLQPDLYEDWEKVKKKNTEINKQKNADKIINYKQKTKDDKNFLIVDKQKGLLHVYDSKGTQLYSSAIDLGARNSDAQTVTKYKDLNNDGKISGSEINKYNVDWTGGNVSTGAGKFYISNIDKKGYEGLPILNMMNESQYENFLKTGKVENVSTSFHKGYVKDDNSRVSNGCVRCDKTTLDNLTKYLENASEVYILPEDKGNEFVYENGKLNFKVNSGKDYNTYIDQAGKTQKGQGINRTKNTLQYYPIKIKLNEEEFKKNKFTYLDLDDESELKNVKSYVKALEENKQKIMKLAKINGDVYNEVAKVSFGILGNESNFADTHDADGNAFRAINKYFNPKAASPDYYSKYYTYRAREDNRSAGLTQLRWSYLNADEKEILKKLNINSNKDFLEPTKAAIGTTAILAIRYNQQLDANEKKNILNNLPKTWGGSSSDNYKTYTNNVIKNSKYLNIVQSSQPNSFSKTKYSNPTTINVNKDGTKTVKYVDPKTNKTHINVTTKDGKSYYKNYSKGGFIMDLDDNEIKKYIDGGYVVKEIN